MRILIFILLGFVTLTAIGSGLMMIADPSGSALGLPLDLLETTPFANFLFPGILLASLVGGSALLALFFWMDRQHAKAYNWSLASGGILSVWILFQMLLVQWFHWLPLVFLVVGLGIVLGAVQLKKKWLV